MKKTIIVIGAILLVACSTQKQINKEVTNTTIKDGLTPSDADRAALKFPGTTLADIAQGKTDYETYCASCHALKSVTSENEEGWRKVVPPMAKKARVDEKTEDLILRYLVTMCTPDK